MNPELKNTVQTLLNIYAPGDKDASTAGDYEDAAAYARAAVWMHPTHSSETLFNLLDKFYPQLSDGEIDKAIKEALNQ